MEAVLLRAFAALLMKHKPYVGLIVFLICLSLLPGIRSSDGVTVEHSVLQARSFVVGNLDIDPTLHDLAHFKGKFYQVNPPLPSILLIPFVILFGNNATGWMLTPLLLWAISFQIFKMCKIFHEEANSLWIIVAYLCGTGIWFCFTQSESIWFLAHLTSFLFMLLALVGAFSSANGWWIGACIGASFLCRQATIHAAFAMIPLLIKANKTSTPFSNIVKCFSSLTAVVLVYMVYNWARFEHPLETGYSLLEQGGFLNERQRLHGIFSLYYFVPNFLLTYVNGFSFSLQGKDLLQGVLMNPFGTSLTVASPFVIFALFFRDGFRPGFLYAITILLINVHFLCYHATGWVQVNCARYTLDFLPLTIPFAIASLKFKKHLFILLIKYSVFLNILALVIIPYLNFLLDLFKT